MNIMPRKKWMIIDGNSLINRTFYALPPLTNSKGIHTNAVYGFASILLKIIEEEHPDYVGVAFDVKRPTFRHEKFQEYKAGRLKMPEELASQLPLLHEMLEAFGIQKISLEGYEADDLIGTLSKIGEEEGIAVNIITGDRDAFQLASPTTCVWYTKRGITDLDKMDEKAILDHYGVTPQQLIDVKALMGDKSDNIPGVPGIGEKTALKLIQQYKNLEEVYNHIEEIRGKKARENLEMYREQAVLSQKLATIVRNIPLDINIEDFRLDNPYNERLIQLFQELEFHSLLEKVGGQSSEPVEEREEVEFKTITELSQLQKLIQDIKKDQILYLQWQLEGAEHYKRELLDLSIGLKNKECFFISFDELSLDILLKTMKEVFEDKTIKKIGHNMKDLFVFLQTQSIQLEGIDFDTYIAAYLLEPSDNNYDISVLSSKYLSKQLTSEEQLLGKGKSKKSFNALTIEEKSHYLMSNLQALIRLHEEFSDKIKQQKMDNLYYEIELPLITVLGSMENLGFNVDQRELEDLSKEFGEKIDQLTMEIHQFAGEKFNINSPKQLGQILFEKLELPIIKKTKTGYSTNVEVLERLKDKHPIIEKIMDIRQLTKLKSTYVDGLMTIIDKDTHNIHSSFNQTITSTGRISSSEPNLQNIPIRLELGRRIRKVFVPRKPEHYLVDADYSQIELRILAHISQDKNLIEAFNHNQDIHTRTASQVFGVPMEEVTSLMRSRAKAVNFGIVYGISDFGLAKDLNIPRQEAKEYIDRYLEEYSGVKSYMENIVKQAQKDGYVTTLFGRRRYLPELQSRNFNIRSFGERIALNTPIQGTAADVIKIAMVKVYDRLKKEKLKSQLILQVHDELIVESPQEELEQVKTIMIEEMENAASLDVILKADINWGKNWYQTK